MIVNKGDVGRWIDSQLFVLHHLDERAHVGKMSVHGSSVWKVLIHSLHELGETAEGDGF